jgi:hypothetical protein
VPDRRGFWQADSHSRGPRFHVGGNADVDRCGPGGAAGRTSARSSPARQRWTGWGAQMDAQTFHPRARPGRRAAISNALVQWGTESLWTPQAAAPSDRPSRRATYVPAALTGPGGRAAWQSRPSSPRRGPVMMGAGDRAATPSTRCSRSNPAHCVPSLPPNPGCHRAREASRARGRGSIAPTVRPARCEGHGPYGHSLVREIHPLRGSSPPLLGGQDSQGSARPISRV